MAFVGNSNTLVTSSADRTMKVWSDGKCAATMDGIHNGEVVAVSVHPTHTYAVSIGGDKAWELLRACTRPKLNLLLPIPILLPLLLLPLPLLLLLHVPRSVRAFTLQVSHAGTSDLGSSACCQGPSCGAWAFYDIGAAECLSVVQDEEGSGGFTCGSFHPDGRAFHSFPLQLNWQLFVRESTGGHSSKRSFSVEVMPTLFQDFYKRKLRTNIPTPDS